MTRWEKIIRRGKSKFYREFMKNLIAYIFLVLFLILVFIGIVRALAV